jgi:hypothetical protein
MQSEKVILNWVDCYQAGDPSIGGIKMFNEINSLAGMTKKIFAISKTQEFHYTMA